MEHTKSIKKFNEDADALFATTTERMMAWANQRLDARISRSTNEGGSPRVLDDMSWVFDTPRNDNSDIPSESKAEE